MQLVEQKLKEIINKELSVTGAAKELSVTRQTIYTWKARYERFGIYGHVKQRKKRTDRPHNKTSEEVEQLVINTTNIYWQDGVEALADHLQRLYNLSIKPTTVYRILKREGIRYSKHHPRTTKRWKKQLYAYQIPGLELQMETKYPFGYKQGRVFILLSMTRVGGSTLGLIPLPTPSIPSTLSNECSNTPRSLFRRLGLIKGVSLEL